jgi:hypothetical protein
MMFKYQVELYERNGNKVKTWAMESKERLVLSHSNGLLMVTNTLHQIIFVAASGWQIILTETHAS